ncbi:exo-beta-N-acetylmuramidase NamZ family protein [Clostridium felsineum]|uniref:Uncharacterized protein n=1 Tax=Clostridium felsineum TaxID=36839 RepID=A0A1S8L6M2_9CLOT|nr:DUF1343 domain-containing protein [Clostridium felsineum]URZ09731.1 hypothetical protein CROST_004240 [Clostridium felsineum]
MVKTGIDNISEYMDIFKGKSVGLITNTTGYNSEFKSTIDIFNEKTDLKALYSPEHGIRGEVQAGDKVKGDVDYKTGIKIYSLYGKKRKPSKEVLKDIDVLVFDIQDVGARFYTYLYTMSYAMESCKEFGKEFVVLDRPNPINGVDVEGNLLDLKYKSFVGRYSIPQRYGLTMGEMARLFNEEFSIGCTLNIVKMTGWQRDMYYEDTGLNWIMPSPNMPTVDTAVVYPGTCIFEGTNISEGRGTTKPFEIIGAPWLDAGRLSDKMNAFCFEGVKFREVAFRPTFSKHMGSLCYGVQIHVTDRKVYKPVKVGLFLYEVIRQESGEYFQFTSLSRGRITKYGIDCLIGDSSIKEAEISAEDIYKRWKSESDEFIKLKNKYSIYGLAKN